MEYEPVIGLEVHVQLLTRSKMFCSCRAEYQSADPNSLVCPVCLGMPGTLPVVNRRAVGHAIVTGLALDCDIATYTKFDRKNYLYPDLMKGYQISQYDAPVATGGRLEVDVGSGDRAYTRSVGVVRVHLEEDVAKLQHFRDTEDRSGQYSLVDVNRGGVPLMEIVSEPDLRSAEEARLYLTGLRSILRYLEVSTGNMEDGSFRCDANVSVRPRGSREYMSRVEVKNMNSFRAVHDALEYEIARQARVVGEGGTVVQETRGWVEERRATVSQRSKEYAHDYRYFPEPDIPPLVIEPAWVEELRRSLPELPEKRRGRFVKQYGLPAYDAALLTGARATADYFEECMSLGGSSAGPARAKTIANWVLVELAHLLGREGVGIQESRVTPAHMADLARLVESDAISGTLAKRVLEESFDTGELPSVVVRERGYLQISDSTAVESAVEEAVGAHPQAVADYVKGKETAARFIVGQVMKLTGGRAKPALVNDLVKRKLEMVRVANGS
ncbi:MAG: Asp-tRNA(Asn)/Glu-tRNA(Gln) amidotransferase subunit GatB [Dehalococcoidia bacterium]|nr:Asp-tRNA(Asn)/Glu-tRNA(Gln) amidotransferase subunit GatB [Dehalococcoidia bacterium]